MSAVTDSSLPGFPSGLSGQSMSQLTKTKDFKQEVIYSCAEEHDSVTALEKKTGNSKYL